MWKSTIRITICGMEHTDALRYQRGGKFTTTSHENLHINTSQHLSLHHISSHFCCTSLLHHIFIFHHSSSHFITFFCTTSSLHHLFHHHFSSLLHHISSLHHFITSSLHHISHKTVQIQKKFTLYYFSNEYQNERFLVMHITPWNIYFQAWQLHRIVFLLVLED